MSRLYPLQRLCTAITPQGPHILRSLVQLYVVDTHLNVINQKFVATQVLMVVATSLKTVTAVEQFGCLHSESQSG